MAKKAGRPIIEIDWKVFEKLCGLQCTQEEIASYFECSVDTIDRACKKNYNKYFAEIFRDKRRRGKISLRRTQYQLALDGDKTMLIWLGKQYLGQTEKHEVSGPGGLPVPIEYVSYGKTQKNTEKKG